jgi:glycosyltransferase involved in cell wall biosynthesis
MEFEATAPLLGSLGGVPRPGDAITRSIPAQQDAPVRVAIVHEWLEQYGGSERVLEQLLGMFPRADLFVVVDFLPPDARAFLRGHAITTSFIQRLPMARRRFRNYLPLMPLAVEQFDLSQYDLVISSNHAVAKGVITGPGQVHISYVHSPMRYAWDLQAQYMRQAGLDKGVKGLFVRWVLHGLRTWDVRSANGVDVFVANSSYIADRIRKVYRRKAIVVPPPVEVDRFTPGGRRGDTYLAATRFVPYKRADLIVQAFAGMPDRRLLLVGDGPERQRVQAIASGLPNVEIRPPVEHAELVRHMQECAAFIHAAEEDFGIAMVEAQACGAPVIAFCRGGARDIVVDLPHPRPTGVLFREQSPRSIAAAVMEFERERQRITTQNCRANAMRFSAAAFQDNLRSVVADALSAAAQPSWYGDAGERDGSPASVLAGT